MQTLLFFDDEPLNFIENITRKQGVPQLMEQSIYHEESGCCSWGRPGVFWDRKSGIWRMIYSADLKHENRGGGYALAVESEDGLNWRPCDTRGVAPGLQGRLAKHQVLPDGVFEELSSVYIDDAAPPDKRIKALTVSYWGNKASHIWTSPDGLKWSMETTPWQTEVPDPPTFVCWNQARGSYIFYSRPALCDRRFCWFETKDWKHYSEATLAMHADSLDPPLSQVYGMFVMPYAGIYIAILWIYHVAQYEKRAYPHLFWGGRVSCQLAYSINGTNWMRAFREPFIANGETGTPSAGSVQISSVVTMEDGSLRLYAGLCMLEHGHCDLSDGYLGAYSLRRDGFMFLESAGGAGRIGTRTLMWGTGGGEINVNATGGYMKVQATEPSGAPIDGYTYDDSDEFKGDDTAWQPKWKKGKTLAALAGRPIRLEVELYNARLYAIRGDFFLIRAAEVVDLQNNGVMPKYKPGFDPFI